MQLICPICNGLRDISLSCSECGALMEDQGHVSDYFGPYSPYEEDLWPQLTGEAGSYFSHRCLHFFSCPRCRKGATRTVTKIPV